jgi:hypothetical protein
MRLPGTLPNDGNTDTLCLLLKFCFILELTGNTKCYPRFSFTTLMISPPLNIAGSGHR